MLTSVIVASGSVVSDPFGGRGGSELSILAPAVDSCQIYLQAATTTTSADFRRIRLATTPGSDWSWPVSSNAAAVSVATAGRFPLYRLECSVAQTDNRSFSVITPR